MSLWASLQDPRAEGKRDNHSLSFMLYSVIKSRNMLLAQSQELLIGPEFSNKELDITKNRQCI